jgi:hypothetical protein
MNSELKRAIYRKKMLHNKFQKYNNSKNWEAYRRQRNYVTKLKSKSINIYYIERCDGGPKSKDFWPTVLCATKKINILTLALTEKKILNETKNHNPPLQVKWSVPNTFFDKVRIY